MYSVAYHYAKDLDSDVFVTSRHPKLIAYVPELFELNYWSNSCFVSGRPGVDITLTKRGVTLVLLLQSTSQPRHAVY